MAVFGFKLGGGGSPLQKLIDGKFKSDEDKQALLAAMAEGGGPAAADMVPLLFAEDATIFQRVGAMFMSRADEKAAAALLDELLERGGTGRANAVKVFVRLKVDLIKTAVDYALEQANADQARKLWDLVMELPGAAGDAYLEPALKSAPEMSRLVALKRLLKARTPEVMRPLLLEYVADREAKVRVAAVEALASYTGDDVFGAMLDRLANDDNTDVRKAAGAFLQKSIASAPPELRPSIMGRLLLAGAPEGQQSLVQSMFAAAKTDDLLLEILTFCKTITGNRHRAIMTALKHLGDPLLQNAMALLQHADADIRIQAVLLLEAFSDPRTTSKLMAMLRDPDWWVRIMVCEALGRLKDQRVIPGLQQMFFDPDSKWAAIDAIGTLGGEAAFTHLSALLKDPLAEVRMAAVTALRATGDARVEATLNEVSNKDPSVEVRLKAVETARELRGALFPRKGSGQRAEAEPAPRDSDRRRRRNRLDGDRRTARRHLEQHGRLPGPAPAKSRSAAKAL